MSQASAIIAAGNLKPYLPPVDVVASELYGIEFKNGTARCTYPENHSRGDRDPSLRYDRRKNRLFCASQQCFGERGVDAFGLVQKMDGCSFNEAKLKLARRYAPANAAAKLRGTPTGKGNRERTHKKSSPINAEILREGLQNDGFEVKGEYYYTNHLRKVRFEHRTKLQPDKDRPQKTYRWEHFRDGEWLVGRGGLEIPLYVNQLMRTSEQLVRAVGVEGEQKADLLGSLGIPAFSFRESLSRKAVAVLHVSQILLWPDKDEAGTTCASRAIKVIRSGVAVQSLKLIRPPDAVPPSGDVVDCIQRLGWGRDEIEGLVSQAEAIPCDDPGAHGPKRSIEDLSEIPSIWTLELNLEWLVEDLIPSGSVVLISSESGTGKTWLAYWLAGAVAYGRSILDREVKQRRVLYLDGENPLYVAKQRLHDLGISETPNLTVWGGWNDSFPEGPGSSIVQRFAREHQGFIIYDPLVAFHPGSEQSSTETRAFMQQFRTLAHLGATVLVLHNSGKADTAKEYRGSSDIKASVDTAYVLKSASGDPKVVDRLFLKCFKGRVAPGQDFGLEFRRGQGFVPLDARAAVVRTGEEVITEILRSDPGSNQKQIIDRARSMGFSKSQVVDALNDGPWVKSKGSRNAHLYRLPEGFDDEYLEVPI